MNFLDLNSKNIGNYGMCGYKSMKKDGLPQKAIWMEKAQKQGLRIKAFISPEDGFQGMIEYIPGEFCWRPVDAKDYMFIHCLLVGMKKVYRNRGIGKGLLEICEEDARKFNLKGVAVVVRKGSFMAEADFFLKKDFLMVDSASPDFRLLAKKFDSQCPDPQFYPQAKGNREEDGSGVIIYRSFQCPYTVKNVDEMVDAAKKEFGLEVEVKEFNSYSEAQTAPGAFGSFGVMYNNRLVAHHPISKTRFVNILKKLIH